MEKIPVSAISIKTTERFPYLEDGRPKATMIVYLSVNRAEVT